MHLNNKLRVICQYNKPDKDCVVIDFFREKATEGIARSVVIKKIGDDISLCDVDASESPLVIDWGILKTALEMLDEPKTTTDEGLEPPDCLAD